MKIASVSLLLGVFSATGAWAQDRIYRCGNEYTNTVSEAQSKYCKLISSSSDSEVIIQRGRNGHFQTEGKVNGQPARFLIDTGATFVSVSNELARVARIEGGAPVLLQTANGKRTGRVVRDVAITIGNVTLTNVAVSVGLDGGSVDEVLFGQSALSRFEMSVVGNKMILRKSK